MHIENNYTNWTVNRFESWIRVGIESYSLEDAGPSAFPEAAHLILQKNSVMDGLRIFYEQFDAQRRENMKQAVALVLASIDQNRKYNKVVENLLELAIHLKAYPVLNVLPSIIGNGFFGEQEDRWENNLFIMTLACVTKLSVTGRKDAEECLHRLILSKNFTPAFSRTALISLCKINPRGLVEHLSVPALRYNLEMQFKIFDKNGKLNLKHETAVNILETIGFINFCESIPNLLILDPYKVSSHDDWLVNELLFNANSPLGCHSDEEILKIFFKDNLKKHYILPGNAPSLQRKITRPIHKTTGPSFDLKSNSKRALVDRIGNELKYLGFS